MNEVTTNGVLKPASDRVTSIDVLRGAALLGILMINISTFALPERYMETILKFPGSLNYGIACIVTVLVEGKMRAMFSLIFGAGVILFVRDKESSGKSAAKVYYRRMAWLALFGLLHAHLLLWGGDILYLYSLCGMVLYFFRNAKPVLLIAAMISVCVVEMALNTYFYNHARTQRLDYLQVETIERQGLPLTAQQQKAKEEWIEKEKEYYPDEKRITKSIEIKRSDYWTIAKDARPGMVFRETKIAPILMLDPLTLMFLGMALFRWGFLSGQLSSKLYRWTLIAGYGIGLPVEIYSLMNSAQTPNQVQFMETHSFNIAVYLYPLERILLMLGHVSLIVLLLEAGLLNSFFKKLAAVGRMAFSNYIIQSIICSFLFFGYGFGFFAMFEYFQLFLIVIAIWIFQLIVSPLWLTYFRFGPLEWAWRSLTYWKIQEMRIKPPETKVRSVPK